MIIAAFQGLQVLLFRGVASESGSPDNSSSSLNTKFHFLLSVWGFLLLFWVSGLEESEQNFLELLHSVTYSDRI